MERNISPEYENTDHQTSSRFVSKKNKTKYNTAKHLTHAMYIWNIQFLHYMVSRCLQANQSLKTMDINEQTIKWMRDHTQFSLLLKDNTLFKVHPPTHVLASAQHVDWHRNKFKNVICSMPSSDFIENTFESTELSFVPFHLFHNRDVLHKTVKAVMPKH